MIYIKLRSLLEQKNMTQSELARLTGIRPSTISDLCNNNAVFLKCDLHDVLEFKDVIVCESFKPF